MLSAIIVVSLKGLLSQLASLPALWRTSRADALIWVGTLLAVVCIDIAAGLAIGVLLSLGVLLWRLQRPPAELLGRLPGTERYVALERYQAVSNSVSRKELVRCLCLLFMSKICCNNSTECNAL